MRGALGSFPIEWKRIPARKFPRETRPRAEEELCAADRSASDREGSPINAFDVLPCRLPKLGALGPDRGIMNSVTRHLATHSTETPSSTSIRAVFRERRQARLGPKNYLLLRVCLFVAVVFIGSCSGREKTQNGRRTGLELNDNFTTPVSDASVFNNIHDLSPSPSHFSRSTKIPKTTKVTNKLKGIPGEKKSADAKNAECKKLEHPEPDIGELLDRVYAHEDLVDSFCESDVVPGCHPVPVVLHISTMCPSSPADISNFSQLKTVVDRCPAVPCCNVTLRCRAKVSLEFNQTFKVVIGSSTTKIVTMLLRNDTVCECGNIVCPAKCPKPFKPVEEKSRCECFCHHKSKDCQAIKDGKRPLKDADKRCVTESKCRMPICSVDRHYNTTTGFCESVKPSSGT